MKIKCLGCGNDYEAESYIVNGITIITPCPYCAANPPNGSYGSHANGKKEEKPINGTKFNWDQ